MKTIIKIWKDPVWSKVISVVILAIGGLVTAKFKSIYENQSFKESFQEIINYEIKIIYIFGLLLLFWMIKWILKPKENSKIIEKLRQKLRSVNKIIDNEQSVITKWQVHFDSYGKPFVSDIDCFCLNHGDPPLKFMNNKCIYPNCKNSVNKFDNYTLKTFVESLVLDEWDKINGIK